MRGTQAPKYLTLWKDGRWVFLKREDFERQGIVKKISKWLRKLIKR
ncbi:hypothetical protein [Hydrogenobaculum phage 1]|nr:hypothetical protein AUR69_gp21 [Hydrogenobaculum phage 1]ALG96932.1 hypothetical protein [Hydrogenobaculum phage 1]